MKCRELNAHHGSSDDAHSRKPNCELDCFYIAEVKVKNWLTVLISFYILFSNMLTKCLENP